MNRPRLVIICACALIACAALAHILATPSEPVTRSAILYTAAKEYDPLAWMRGGERFPQRARILISEGGHERSFLPEFFATADPNISFDGKSVLFAGKKTSSDSWQIWEMAFPNGKPRPITSAQEDAIRPLYLPDDRVVYARKQAGKYVIESIALEGGKPLQLTFAGSSLPTDILLDGRILFESGYPLGSGSTAEIYTVYSDGSGVESYRCDHGISRYAAKQAGNGDIVFTHGRGLAKFTSALAHEVTLNAPVGEYAGGVAEGENDEWLVSWRANKSRDYELRRWKLGDKALTSVKAEQGMNLIQPVLVAPRPVPNRHPSGLHDWTAANLMVLNAYTSKYRLASGSVTSVRVYAQDEVLRSKVLGTAPVGNDGSFYVHVPADTPISFELLDSKGRTLKRQAGWFWARGGEQRICVGCHAGPERAPENAVPAILLQSTNPTDLTSSQSKSQMGGN